MHVDFEKITKNVLLIHSFNYFTKKLRELTQQLTKITIIARIKSSNLGTFHRFKPRSVRREAENFHDQETSFFSKGHRSNQKCFIPLNLSNFFDV